MENLVEMRNIAFAVLKLLEAVRDAIRKPPALSFALEFLCEESKNGLVEGTSSVPLGCIGIEDLLCILDYAVRAEVQQLQLLL